MKEEPGSVSPDLAERIGALSRMLAEAERIVVFTGAGISTDSGLPDFRGPDGVWTRRDRGLPPPQTGRLLEETEPNAGHLALVKLQESGRLAFLISQNVDNLHLRSGIEPSKIAELHGNSAQMKCLRCDRRFRKTDLGWDEKLWGKGYRSEKPQADAPRCACGGRIISSVVNFGDPMPEREMKLAEYHADHCDLFLVIGSSLVVSPANSFPLSAKRRGAGLVIINRGETPLDKAADLRFHESIGDVFPPAVRMSLETHGG
ncbi:MAG: NAD-dependent deacetylase [Spirochaetales bacterium]|nr:MAG: NAD-dependent deacetylase [Spirochaetales bacterium]